MLFWHFSCAFFVVGYEGAHKKSLDRAWAVLEFVVGFVLCDWEFVVGIVLPILRLPDLSFGAQARAQKKHNLFSVLGSQKTVVLLGLPRPPWIPVHSFRRSAAETSSGLGAASAAADTSSPQVSADQFQLERQKILSSAHNARKTRAQCPADDEQHLLA